MTRSSRRSCCVTCFAGPVATWSKSTGAETRRHSTRSCESVGPGREAFVLRPLIEQALRLVLFDRAAVNPHLHQVIPGLAYERAGRDPQVRHDLVSVELRSERLEVLLLRQTRDALLEVVLQPLEPHRPFRVTGRHVRASQLVQL